MNDKPALSPREAAERELARLLEQVDAIRRDIAEFDRLAAKYSSAGSAASSEPTQPIVSNTVVEETTARSEFDGTIRSLIECYKNDPDSTFRELRFHSRVNYGHFLKRIGDDHGSERIADLSGRDMKHWHEAWSASGISMAHSLMKHLRTMLTFGATILESKDCLNLKTILADMRFKMSKPRTEQMTAKMVRDFCEVAHRYEMHSLALAQAIQFECGLRQKDVIGEWVPESEPEYSEVKHKSLKWLRGIRWDEIDRNLILRHTPSKGGKEIEINLNDARIVREEFARLGLSLPKSGPVIVEERTGLPYKAIQFRTLWRKLATEAGVPKSVRSMDSRPRQEPDDAPPQRDTELAPAMRR